MWNEKRSLWLSKMVTLLFIGILAAALIGAPYIVKVFIKASANAHPWHYPFFLASAYSGGLIAAAILVLLYLLLQNIAKEEIFVEQNVSFLRSISWLCIVGGIIALASTFYYLPWLLVAAAAALIGLIVRVIKNIIAEAIALKKENDFTI